MQQEKIGDRVLARIAQASPDRTHRAVASAVGMTPDAFSRALRGQRAFSSIELARVADLLDADIHWLITGEPDPHRLVIAARHHYDFESGRRDVPGQADDEDLLEGVGLAYRQAYEGAPLDASNLPASPSAVREALGQDFIRPFAERLESRVGVDVVRLSALSTSYCFSVAGRQVIVVAATGNWFRENWSIAHEIGHLAEGHLDSERTPAERNAHEASANAFAAELLLPADQMRAMDWIDLDSAELARRVWETGVSTDALARRLSNLGIQASDLVANWATQPTQRLLRYHWESPDADTDLITKRMDDAAARRFPLSLQDAHLAMIARGELGKGTLAWMLGIAPEALEVDIPAPVEEFDTDALATALGH
jgi:hypothetical protein